MCTAVCTSVSIDVSCGQGFLCEMHVRMYAHQERSFDRCVLWCRCWCFLFLFSLKEDVDAFASLSHDKDQGQIGDEPNESVYLLFVSFFYTHQMLYCGCCSCV